MKLLPWLVATFLLTFVITACVMPSDLRSLADSQETYQREVTGILEDSTLTADEKVEAITDEQEVLSGDIEDLLALINDRTTAIVRAPGALTGNGLLDLLLTGVASAVAGGAATNRIRDQRRLARGEPVTPTPTHS